VLAQPKKTKAPVPRTSAKITAIISKVFCRKKIVVK
jgi:hypothetical protein